MNGVCISNLEIWDVTHKCDNIRVILIKVKLINIYAAQRWILLSYIYYVPTLKVVTKMKNEFQKILLHHNFYFYLRFIIKPVMLLSYNCYYLYSICTIYSVNEQ